MHGHCLASAEWTRHNFKLGSFTSCWSKSPRPQTFTEPSISVSFAVTRSCDMVAINQLTAQPRTIAGRLDHQETNVPAPHKPRGDGRVWCQLIEGTHMAGGESHLPRWLGSGGYSRSVEGAHLRYFTAWALESLPGREKYKNQHLQFYVSACASQVTVAKYPKVLCDKSTWAALRDALSTGKCEEIHSLSTATVHESGVLGNFY